jgi:hypothetical protein
MRHGIPVAFFVYRLVWMTLHVALVAFALTVAALWLAHDGRGIALADQLWTGLAAAQRAVARAIPFPWGG